MRLRSALASSRSSPSSIRRSISRQLSSGCHVRPSSKIGPVSLTGLNSAMSFRSRLTARWRSVRTVASGMPRTRADLVVLEALDVLEDEDPALLAGQPGHRPAQTEADVRPGRAVLAGPPRAVPAQVGVGRAVLHGSRSLAEEEPPDPLFPELVPVRVGGDGEEPGLGLAPPRLDPLRGRPIGPKPGLLEQVLGVPGVPGEGAGESVDVRRVHIVDLVEDGHVFVRLHSIGRAAGRNVSGTLHRPRGGGPRQTASGGGSSRLRP